MPSWPSPFEHISPGWHDPGCSGGCNTWSVVQAQRCKVLPCVDVSNQCTASIINRPHDALCALCAGGTHAHNCDLPHQCVIMAAGSEPVAYIQTITKPYTYVPLFHRRHGLAMSLSQLPITLMEVC